MLNFRLNHIKQKQADHIAIHLQNDNTVTYSSELLSETRINRCLKEKLEKLLRGCFQWDNAKRNQSIFKDLKKILSKRFLTIFSVRNCEYFSYEYDESTLISTLRTWIARETKIYDSEQILLTANNCTNVFPASALIIHYVKEVIIEKLHFYLHNYLLINYDFRKRKIASYYLNETNLLIQISSYLT